jgi:hypothetical protein
MKSAASGCKTTFLFALAFAASLCAGSAFAADAKPDAKPLTPQQQKFGACAKDAHAKGLKGDEYKAFMSTCAKADSATPATTAATDPNAGLKTVPANATQQEKMKSCNADAKTKALAGDARKEFMSNCLKGSPAAAAAAH